MPEPASTSSAVRMTKYTHSCVRLERGGRSLVIDPGVWSEPAALMAASAVLITHEHADHIDADRLVATLAGDPACRVFAPAPVAESLSDLGNRFVAVAPGDRFGAAGLDVQVVGGEHAETYEGLPGCAKCRLCHRGRRRLRPHGHRGIGHALRARPSASGTYPPNRCRQAANPVTCTVGNIPDASQRSRVSRMRTMTSTPSPRGCRVSPLGR